MRLYKEKKDCCGCGACANTCPAEAISMVKDEEGFLYPHVDPTLCTDCGLCQKVCPIKTPDQTKSDHLFYGAQAKNGALRLSGSSGGVFSLLSQYVLDRQGVAFGAAFYNDYQEVAHTSANHPRQLEQLKRTKYVQSNIGDCFRQIKELLSQGQWVLFCGTPCQTRGLQLMLGVDYSRLITVDLVCYGVPSPGLWQDYVQHLENRYGSRLTGFSFRDKRNRDNGHTLSYTIGDKEIAKPLTADPYCQLYFWNYTIRPSCHKCKFCSPRRSCDFTLGDFWGIEKVKPEMDDGMGNSLVILHSKKAQEIWQQISSKLSSFACEQEQTVQPRLTTPTPPARQRELFMKTYRFLPFSLFIRLTPVWGILKDIDRHKSEKERKMT